MRVERVDELIQIFKNKIDFCDSRIVAYGGKEVFEGYINSYKEDKILYYDLINCLIEYKKLLEKTESE